MLQKIKSSLSIKTFLKVFSFLVLTFTICASAIYILLPRIYEQRFESQFKEMVESLSRELGEVYQEEFSDLITSFAFEHHAHVQLELGDELIYANFHPYQEDENIQSLSMNIDFIGNISGNTYTLNVETSMWSIHHTLDIIGDIIPYLIFFIFVTSMAFSWLFAHYLSKPMIQISNSSKKMQQLDLNVRCRLSRTDEMGTLANNLDDMADKLSQTVNDLQTANVLLGEEVTKRKENEIQKKNFFIGVSHELKTPLMILTTQLNGMINKISGYQDRDLYLIRARKTTEEMSNLVNKLLDITQIKSAEETTPFERIDVRSLMDVNQHAICVLINKFPLN